VNNMFSNKKIIFSLVLPGFLLFVFAVLAPIFLSVYFGMTDYTGMSKPNFIGFKNFADLITSDSTFWNSLLHAIVLGLLIVVFQNPLCILLAIMADRISGKHEKFIRALMFVPCIISIVITSKLWVNIYNPDYGFLNKLLGEIGLGFLKQDWLGNPHIALYSIFFVIIWQGFGWGFLIYYAGLKGIPEQLYEAAMIDGATGLKLYTKITLPLLMPVMRICIVLVMISSMKQMETIYIMTDGGPGNVTQFLANYLYRSAFKSYEFGYGSAISVLFVVACLIMTVIMNKLLRKDIGEY
jgi:raffinose/stachyose/melibiose transport system permease protein